MFALAKMAREERAGHALRLVCYKIQQICLKILFVLFQGNIYVLTIVCYLNLYHFLNLWELTVLLIYFSYLCELRCT